MPACPLRALIDLPGDMGMSNTYVLLTPPERCISEVWFSCTKVPFSLPCVIVCQDINHIWHLLQLLWVSPTLWGDLLICCLSDHLCRAWHILLLLIVWWKLEGTKGIISGIWGAGVMFELFCLEMSSPPSYNSLALLHWQNRTSEVFAEKIVPSEDPPQLLLGQSGCRVSSLFYQLLFFEFNQLLSNIF